MGQVTLKSILLTFFMAMAPVVELRGALPFGVISGLGVKEALVISILGNLVPVPFIILFIRKIIKWSKEKSPKLREYALHLEKKVERKKGRVLKYEFFGLLVLVAIPLPGTGAWTGALIAGMLDMRLKQALKAIIPGVIIAGFLVAGATYGVSEIMY